MNSFAFLPRPLRSKGAQQPLPSERSRHHFPPSLVVKANLTFTEGNEESDAMNRTALTSLVEQLVPRSCHYTQVAKREQGKVQILIRASSSSKATQVKDRLSGHTRSGICFDNASILQGEEEARYWEKLPLRVKNRAEKQAKAISIRNRRGGKGKKRRKAEG